MIHREDAGSGLNPQSSILNPARSTYPHPVIAREGWPFIAASVIAAALAHWLAGPWWAAPLWLVVVFMLQFFRDPPRAIPQEPKAVLSPADGRIVTVERARDPYLERDALKMSV
ncbi:MAG: phosphatidylserine decarboxylase, partial [Betaproteobacteria bacterium]|nr:phosphatidylserine decarboxylase [Betaproteobacteria bacterium]